MNKIIPIILLERIVSINGQQWKRLIYQTYLSVFLVCFTVILDGVDSVEEEQIRPLAIVVLHLYLRDGVANRNDGGS